MESERILHEFAANLKKEEVDLKTRAEIYPDLYPAVVALQSVRTAALKAMIRGLAEGPQFENVKKLIKEVGSHRRPRKSDIDSDAIKLIRRK